MRFFLPHARTHCPGGVRGELCSIACTRRSTTWSFRARTWAVEKESRRRLKARPLHQTLECSFLDVSKPNVANEYSLCTIFLYLEDVCTSAPLYTQNVRKCWQYFRQILYSAHLTNSAHIDEFGKCHCQIWPNHFFLSKFHSKQFQIAKKNFKLQ